jgi:N-acetylmuramoyl-L-alanine amidase
MRECRTRWWNRLGASCAGRLLRAVIPGLIVAWTMAGAAAAQPQPGNGDTALIVDVGLSASPDATRLRLVASRPVQINAFALDAPARLVIDLPGAAFHVPAATGRAGGGLVRSFRHGLFAPGRSRLVLDLAEPARVRSVEHVSASDGVATVTVIEMVRVDRGEFAKDVARTEKDRSVETTAAPAPARQEADARPLVVIDPGHGGVDPGALGGAGAVEKEITLAFALELRQRLEAGGRVRVALTRDTDVFVSLGERVRFARERNAALFVSIHADSLSDSPEVRGATVYTLGDRASDAESARLAEKENRVDQLSGVETGGAGEEVLDILMDLTRRETKAFSSEFAHGLVQAISDQVRLNKNPIRQAAFRVLRAPDVPSVLMELGYLSSGKDLEVLRSPEWRAKTSEAVAASIVRFVTRGEKRASRAP